MDAALRKYMYHLMKSDLNPIALIGILFRVERSADYLQLLTNFYEKLLKTNRDRLCFCYGTYIQSEDVQAHEWQ